MKVWRKIESSGHRKKIEKHSKRDGWNERVSNDDDLNIRQKTLRARNMGGFERKIESWVMRLKNRKEYPAREQRDLELQWRGTSSNSIRLCHDLHSPELFLLLFHSLLVMLLWSYFYVVSTNLGGVPLNWKPMVERRKEMLIYCWVQNILV